MDWKDLVGMKVAALRGHPKSKGMSGTKVPLSYVLFDDGKTFLEMDEQSAYDYHDCNSYARSLNLWQDAQRWQDMMDKKGFEEPTDTRSPFGW